MTRTLAQSAAAARALNESKLFSMRATSETLQFFTEEQITKAFAARIASIDRHTKPSTKGGRRGKKQAQRR